MLLPEAIARVQEADNKALRSRLAFALGPEKFGEYWEAEAKSAEARLEAMYARSSGQVSSGGDSQTNG